MNKYVIFVNTEFYPYVYEEYNDLERARSVFEQKEPYDEDVYLCEIIEKKTDFQPRVPVKNVFDLLPKEKWIPRSSSGKAKQE